MTSPFIDTHIHLDTYSDEEQKMILESLPGCGVETVISVSMHLESSHRNLKLAQQFHGLVKPAFGFHPEQPLPSDDEIKALFSFMESHVNEMIAVGEVGLPYYSRLEAMSGVKKWDNEPYKALLEQFIVFAKKHDKPIILHAVYEDADTACDLLKKHGVTSAHFHWFKGSSETIRRMNKAGYYISFTPDLLYESEIRDLARQYPRAQVMTETDGPWPFEGPFEGHMTHPGMTAHVAAAWAELQGLSLAESNRILYDNASRFYRLND
ncbi:TatD family hydrolase [Paenibacillus sp. GCM10028914]|uniref:TatD family hydrolase n=1 Tax=Paenibacillus sp. GCM10028914 TaxID=3273416 RepID=UPI0036191B95